MRAPHRVLQKNSTASLRNLDELAPLSCLRCFSPSIRTRTHRVGDADWLQIHAVKLPLVCHLFFAAAELRRRFPVQVITPISHRLSTLTLCARIRLEHTHKRHLVNTVATRITMAGVFVVGAKRTAFGSFGGSLARLRSAILEGLGRMTQRYEAWWQSSGAQRGSSNWLCTEFAPSSFTVACSLAVIAVLGSKLQLRCLSAVLPRSLQLAALPNLPWSLPRLRWHPLV